jgi:hypothetical protein
LLELNKDIPGMDTEDLQSSFQLSDLELVAIGIILGLLSRPLCILLADAGD